MGGVCQPLQFSYCLVDSNIPILNDCRVRRAWLVHIPNKVVLNQVNGLESHEADVKLEPFEQEFRSFKAFCVEASHLSEVCLFTSSHLAGFAQGYIDFISVEFGI